MLPHAIRKGTPPARPATNLTTTAHEANQPTPPPTGSLHRAHDRYLRQLLEPHTPPHHPLRPPPHMRRMLTLRMAQKTRRPRRLPLAQATPPPTHQHITTNANAPLGSGCCKLSSSPARGAPKNTEARATNRRATLLHVAHPQMGCPTLTVSSALLLPLHGAQTGCGSGVQAKRSSREAHSQQHASSTTALAPRAPASGRSSALARNAPPARA